MKKNIKQFIKKVSKFIPDKIFLKIQYRYYLGKKLNLSNPKTFNEKLQWLKLYDRNILYTKLVDKYEVRKYIGKKIGEEYLIPLIGVYQDVNEINFKSLPNKFVLKCTHDSGGLVICRDKENLNLDKVKKKINKSLKQNYYYLFREWPYKNVKPKIICEKYMVDESKTQLKDYKFFCFNGEPKLMFIGSDRGNNTKFDFFDIDFNRLNLKQHYPNSSNKFDKPKSFEKMVELSKILSKGFPQVRIDFYDIDGKVYFGEFTFFHFSGLEKFEPEEFDEILGSYINLPNNN